MKLSQLDNYCIFLASKYFNTIEDHINLPKVCKRLKLNIEKFHFNPLPLNERTREYFPYLQTLYQYYSYDNLFEDDKRIIARKQCKIEKYNLLKDQIQQIEEWTKLKCEDVLFDSTIDDWSQNTSVLNERIIGKKQIVFLIEDEDGEKFGYYLNTEVIEKYGDWIETDNKSFEFNLESNGRLKQPMKFEIKDLKYGGYELYIKSIGYLIVLGDIYLMKENKKNESYCYQFEDWFDYHGIENALCGKKPYPNGEDFTPKRILVIQMK